MRELPELRVSVDEVVYMPELETGESHPHPFVYYITIHNESPETVTVKGRKWVITDIAGGVIVVEGDGVVGKFPRLHPGDSFSYNSCHAAALDSHAEGAYLAVTDLGEPVFTRIPRFDMRIPFM